MKLKILLLFVTAAAADIWTSEQPEFPTEQPRTSTERPKTTPEQPDCQMGPVDLVFVVDESGSIGSYNFQIGLTASVGLVDTLDIGTSSTQSRVGYVIFDIRGHVVFGMDTYTTKSDVENAILSIKYGSGDNSIADGMRVAIEEVFKASPRSGVKRIMIIVTDGQDNTDVGTQQLIASQNGIDVYAVGIGYVDINELTTAAGDPSRVIVIDNYSELLSAFGEVCSGVESSSFPLGCGCEDPYSEAISDTWLDIIFVMDSSDETSAVNFEGAKSFLESVSWQYAIGRSTHADHPEWYNRVAVINNADEAVIVADLNTFKSATDMENAVDQMKHLGGGFNPGAGFAEAAKMVHASEESSQRLNVRKVIVLFSSSIIDCSKETSLVAEAAVGEPKSKNAANKALCSVVAQMKNDGVTIITVAVGLDSANLPYMDIANTCQRLNNTGDMNMAIMKALCQANCFCLSPSTQFEIEDSCDTYGECLQVADLPESYKAAQKACVRADQKMADVFSMEKHDFLRDMHVAAGFTPYWLGGKVYGDTIYWESGRNTSATGNHGDFVYWSPTYKADATKPNLLASSGFTLSWTTDKDGAMIPSHYYSCQASACSVLKYCESTKA